MRLVMIAASLLAAAAAYAQTPQTAAPPPKAAPPAAAAATTARGAPMDINSASVAELETLKGVGEARAAAIVKGRPYKGKDDLVQKKILSKSVYDGIKDQIVARQK